MSMQNIKRLPRSIHGPLRSSIVMVDLPRVVEELVYNSLDACATKVSVFVNIRSCYIKIEDDGRGITREELVILGENYATSKSGLLDDMKANDHGSSFKGAAFLSLSDISIVEVRTKARGNPNAYCKILKGSRCLFLGIDDQREGVGTAVTVRDLFYNQPVRRRYMQSSSKKVLHCVKKVIMRAALVHPQVFFKLIDTDSEDELLCTVPSSSPLPLVSRMFGEVSGSLYEICFSDDMLKLSGYISRPGGVLSTKSFQFLYVNSRFVSNGPVHNLLNNIASGVLSSLAVHESGNPMMHGRKRQKVQHNAAFILNLRCPLSHYDLHFEPSKTIIEFKDWDTILTFFEKAVRHSWQQHLALSLQGKSFSQWTCAAPTYSETWNRETSLSDIAKSFDATTRQNSNQMLQNLHCIPKTIPLDFASEDDGVSQDHGRRMNRHMKILSNSEPCQIDTDCAGQLNSRSYFDNNEANSRYDNIGLHIKAHNEFGNSLFLQNHVISHPVSLFKEKHDNSSLSRENCPEKVRNLSREETWSPQSLNRHNAAIDAQQVELSPSSNRVLRKSESESGGSCFLMQNMNCDSAYDSRHGGFDVRFGLSSSDLFLYDDKCLASPKYTIRSLNSINRSPWETVVGSVPSFHTIRKCQTSENVNMSSLDFNEPCFFDQCYLSNGQRLDIDVQELAMSSRCGSPSLCAWHPKSYRTVFDPAHKRTIEENLLSGSETWPYQITGRKDKLLSSIQEGSAGIHPSKSCTVTKLDENHSSNHMMRIQSCYPSNEIAFRDVHLSIKMNDEMSLFNPDTSDISSTLNDFKPKFHAVQKGNMMDEIIWYGQQSQSHSLLSNYKERSRRSQSAPPFYRGKRKYTLLCGCLTAVAATKPSALDSKKFADSAYLQDFPSPVYASQSCPQPIQSQDSPSCSIVPSSKKSSTFLMPSSYHEVQEYSASQPAKWRSRARQTTDEVISHEASERINDILDISSGILHFSGDSLVPERIDKDGLHDTRVLLQLDKKFIPVMAGEILLIIDQHAADERIRLEELRRQVLSESGEGKGITYLDSEEELVLPEMGFQLLEKYAEKIEKWGWIFDIHNPMPDSCNKNLNLLTGKKPGVVLVAVPCILGINLTQKDLLEYIEQLVETDGSSTLPPSVHRILNFKACRGAIMFGDSLLPSECSLIVDELKATSLCFQCAHGRPTMVPLLNMSALHLQLAKLEMNKGRSKGTSWHGLCHQRRPSAQRAQQLLDSAKRFHNA